MIFQSLTEAKERARMYTAGISYQHLIYLRVLSYVAATSL